MAQLRSSTESVLATSGLDLGPEVLGVALLEEGPDDGERSTGWAAGQAMQLLGREDVLRQELAEPVVVDLADECPHGGTVPRTAGGNQAESA